MAYLVKQHTTYSYVVSPIFMRLYGVLKCDLNSQSACKERSHIIKDIESGLTVVTKLFQRDILQSVQKEVEQNLASCGIKVKPVLDTLITSIPVYLVTKEMQGKSTAIGYDDGGPHKVPTDEELQKLEIYDISLGTLREWLEESKLGCLNKISSRDILGLYCNEGVINSANSDAIKQKRRIFIWIDKIDDCAYKLNIEYKNLLALVLCHEYMHAIMDLFYKVVTPSTDWEKVYYHFREESLANGLAIYLMKEYLGSNNNEFEEIKKFVKVQPDAYKLGLQLQDKAILQQEVPGWIAEKRNWPKCDRLIQNRLRRITNTINKGSLPLHFFDCIIPQIQKLKMNSNSLVEYKSERPDFNANDIVFDCDIPFIKEYIQKQKNPDYILQLQFPPEPWLGNIYDPSVIILSANPGFTSGNEGNVAQMDIMKPKVNDYVDWNINQLQGYPDLLKAQLSGQLDDSHYWKNKLADIIKTLRRPNDYQYVASKFAIFEVHPYLSKKYCKPKKMLPSQEIILQAIKDIINRKNDVVVIIFREQSYWMEHLEMELKDLASDNRLFTLSSAMNNKVTNKNITLYDKHRWDIQEKLNAYFDKRHKQKAFDDLLQKIK